MNIANSANNIAIDTKGLDGLKVAAKEESPEAIKEVAKQFESLFMNMLMKSMRAATPHESPFDNEQTRTFTSMLDQQLSQNLAEKGLGLSDIIAKQLSKGVNPVDTAMQQAVSSPDADKKKNDTGLLKGSPLTQTMPQNQHLIQAYMAQLAQNPSSVNQGSVADGLQINTSAAFAQLSQQQSAKQAKPSNPINGVQDFKNVMTRHAEIASASSGIPSHLMLGQAALESGWGQRQITGQNGEPSYNLFGIKAGKNWHGKTVDTLTTEYVNGIKHKRVETFRAYDSYADSFKDFANLMQNNQRYEKVLNNLDSTSGYAKALQDAGYATDPNYAKKLTSVIEQFVSS